MKARLYMDVHVDARVTRLLRERGIDVVTAQEDGAAEFPDPDLLDRATHLGRILVTEDKDFLPLAAALQHSGQTFEGIVFVHRQTMSLTRYADDLTLYVEAEAPESFRNLVRFLPI